MKDPPYLLLKATAAYIPLLDNSVSLVIATPPYLGERRVRKEEFCTHDPKEYQRWMTQFLTEATRIVKPYGHILLYASRPEPRRSKAFDVLQKRVRRGRWACVRVGSKSFTAHHANVKNFTWEALPIRLYRALIHQYSEPGETIAHVFSGSGNSGIAAMQMARKPILIDLHYHRQIQRRLNKRTESKPLKPTLLPKGSGKPMRWSL